MIVIVIVETVETAETAVTAATVRVMTVAIVTVAIVIASPVETLTVVVDQAVVTATKPLNSGVDLLYALLFSHRLGCSSCSVGVYVPKTLL